MPTFKKRVLKSQELLREMNQCLQEIQKKYDCKCSFSSRIIPESEGNMVEIKISSNPLLSVELHPEKFTCSARKIRKEVLPILDELANT